jgi:hypothetical protein
MKGLKLSVDISNIAKENHQYAIHLATFENIITYKNGVYEIADVLSKKEPFEVIDFWRNISLAAEVLLKAILLKHHISFFRKRANYEYGEKVSANTNIWLKETIERLEINYIAQINTGTISTTLKYAKKEFFNKIEFDQEKIKLIEQMFYIIIRTRRNRNSHFFFPNQSLIDTSEIEMIFLPLLNILEELYDLE